MSPADPDLVIFSAHDALRRSTNSLRTVTTVVAAASDPSVVYAEADGYLLYRSDDAGASWRLVANVRANVLNAVP